MVGQLSARRVKVHGYHNSYFRKHRFFDLLLSETDGRFGSDQCAGGPA